MNVDEAIGKVVHYYDKVGVAIVELKKLLKVGDKVKFVKGDVSFEQMIESIQIEHTPVVEGKPGEAVGVKVNESAKEGTLLYPAPAKE